MKRLIFALFLLILIITICILGRLYINKNINELEAALEELITAFTQNNFTSAEDLSNKLEQDWVKKEEKLSVFVNKSTIEEIGLTVARIKSCAKHQNADFLTECESLSVLLAHVKNDENLPFLGVF